jgi:CheY-like chemotaxis protein
LEHGRTPYPGAPRFPITIAIVESHIERGGTIQTKRRSDISLRILSAAAFLESALRVRRLKVSNAPPSISTSVGLFSPCKEPYSARHVASLTHYDGRKRLMGGKMGRTTSDKRPVVLVVEDEILTRMNAVEMVNEAGFEAIAACDAEEAIHLLETRNDIRAVFTDVQMPGSMDGLRLARVVRNRWPPVALIVTSGQTDELERDLPTGGTILPKPYAQVQIETILRQLICWNDKR